MDRRDRDFLGVQASTAAATARPLTHFDLEGYIREKVLAPGERVVWRGRPRPIEVASSKTKAMLIGLAFLAVCVSAVLRQKPGWEWQAPLFFVAFGLMAMQPWLAARRARRTYYAVTDQRVLIVEVAGVDPEVTTVIAEQFDRFELNDFGNGRGNITLRETVRDGRRGEVRTVEFTDALWGVEFPAAAEAVRALVDAPFHPAP